MSQPRGFSLVWTPENDRLTSGEYTIMQEGWHDTGQTIARCVLRFRNTVVFESSGVGSNDPFTECLIEADRHRGIGNPGGLPS